MDCRVINLPILFDGPQSKLQNGLYLIADGLTIRLNKLLYHFGYHPFVPELVAFVDEDGYALFEPIHQIVWEYCREVRYHFAKNSAFVLAQLVLVDNDQELGLLSVLEKQVDVVLVGDVLETIVVLIVEARRVPDALRPVILSLVALLTLDLKIADLVPQDLRLLHHGLHLILHEDPILVGIVQVMILRVQAVDRLLIRRRTLLPNEKVGHLGRGMELAVADLPLVGIVEREKWEIGLVAVHASAQALVGQQVAHRGLAHTCEPHQEQARY